MNIGIVTTWHEGGAGNVSRAYVETLQAQGHSVWIYARGGQYFPKGDPDWDAENVTPGIRYTPPGFSKRNSQFINIFHLLGWLRTHAIDVLIFNEEHRFDTVLKVKSLGYAVGSYIDYYKQETVASFAAYDFLLCNTRRHYGVFSHFPGAHFIPWGTNIDLYKPERSLNRQPGDGVVFFHSAGHGGINCRKGTDLLVRAFQSVAGNARLIIHSQAPIAKYGDDIAALVRDDPRIEFIRKTVSAPGLYHLGDVFVYPSRLDGIGLCVPEALACGLPVITADCEPMSEFVSDGVNGLLVKIASTRMRDDGYYWPEKTVSVEDLAVKMQIYVDHGELVSQHGEQARRDAEVRLDWGKNSRSLGDLLRQVAERAATRKRLPNLAEKMMWKSEVWYVASLSVARAVVKSLPGLNR